MTLNELQKRPDLADILEKIRKVPAKPRPISYYVPAIVALRAKGYEGAEIQAYLIEEGCGDFPKSSIYRVLREQAQQPD